MPGFPDLSSYTPMGVALLIILILATALIWVCRRIITGKLMPRVQHDELMSMALARGDDWKDVAEEALEQNSLLLKTSKITNAVFKPLGGEHVAETEDPAR